MESDPVKRRIQKLQLDTMINYVWSGFLFIAEEVERLKDLKYRRIPNGFIVTDKFIGKRFRITVEELNGSGNSETSSGGGTQSGS